MSVCDRCGRSTNITIMSMFSTETICGPCSDREQKHPLYEEARRVEGEAVRRGDFYFPGIGTPLDLRRRLCRDGHDTHSTKDGRCARCGHAATKEEA